MECEGERTLRSEKVQIERKTFFLDLKENDRGRFLRITEDVVGIVTGKQKPHRPL